MNRIAKHMVILTVVSLVSVSYSLPLGADMKLETKPVLSLQVAKVIADACESMATEKGWNMNITIVDDGANLLLFRRMPNAFLGSIDISLDKARTSARMAHPTSWVADLAYGKDLKGGPLPGLAHVTGFAAFGGGLPIKVGSTVIGAIGVSGASAEQDEACAQAGLDALAEFLK